MAAQYYPPLLPTGLFSPLLYTLMPPPPKTNAWCFTYYDFCRDSLPKLEAGMKYICYQEEICPTTDRPHLQGYVYFKESTRLTAVKKALGSNTVHVEACKGTLAQNLAYTSKSSTSLPGTWVEYGVKPRQGKRTDLEEACATLLETRSIRTVAEEHSSTYVKYHGGLQKLLDATVPPPTISDEVELRPWQQELYEILMSPPDSRSVYFVVDKQGNQGKSFFAKYMCCKHQTYLTGPAKYDRIYYTYHDEPIVIFDIPRTPHDEASTRDICPYHVIEAIKTGIIPAGMYGTPQRIRMANVHVVVMMNYLPDMSALSKDRYKIKEL